MNEQFKQSINQSINQSNLLSCCYQCRIEVLCFHRHCNPQSMDDWFDQFVNYLSSLCLPVFKQTNKQTIRMSYGFEQESHRSFFWLLTSSIELTLRCCSHQRYIVSSTHRSRATPVCFNMTWERERKRERKREKKLRWHLWSLHKSRHTHTNNNNQHVHWMTNWGVCSTGVVRLRTQSAPTTGTHSARQSTSKCPIFGKDWLDDRVKVDPTSGKHFEPFHSQRRKYGSLWESYNNFL